MGLWGRADHSPSGVTAHSRTCSCGKSVVRCLGHQTMDRVRTTSGTKCSVSRSGYVAWNDWRIRDYETESMWKDAVMVWDAVPGFQFKESKNQRKEVGHIASIWTYISHQNFWNMYHEWYPVYRDVWFYVFLPSDLDAGEFPPLRSGSFIRDERGRDKLLKRPRGGKSCLYRDRISVTTLA
jgi:hypothetical protein